MMCSFGEKIRLLREKEEMNQTQLGKAVNMTQRKVSYIECGKYEPSIDDIKAFCAYVIPKFREPLIKLQDPPSTAAD